MVIIVLVVLLVVMFMFPTFRCAVSHPIAVLTNAAVDVFYYFCHKKWTAAPFGQITGYIADSATSFGCGKTLSATDYIVSLYRQYDGVPVWCPERKKFVTQRFKVMSNVNFKTIPYESLVSLSQFVQFTDISHDLDMKNDTWTVIYVLIDEASSQLNSRAFKGNFDAYFIERLLTSRHVHASMILTSQRAGMVDKLMRDCCHLYIGCNKTWRFQRLNYYDAYEVENAQSPALVAPLHRTCWFIRDSSFANYDTYASVQTLRKSCESGDRLSEAEILALQCNQPSNMEGVVKPSRRWLKGKKQQNRK